VRTLLQAGSNRVYDTVMEVPTISAMPFDGRTLREYMRKKRDAFQDRYGKSWTDFMSSISPSFWPKQVNASDAIIWCERDLRDYLILNPAMRRRLGWDGIERITSTVPDMTVRVQGSEKLMLVELEFDAANFVKHQHLPLVHLVLSFKRPVGFDSIRGVPVWSMYRYEWGQPEILKWSLARDIRGTPDHVEEEEESKPIKHDWIKPPRREKRPEVIPLMPDGKLKKPKTKVVGIFNKKSSPKNVKVIPPQVVLPKPKKASVVPPVRPPLPMFPKKTRLIPKRKEILVENRRRVSVAPPQMKQAIGESQENENIKCKCGGYIFTGSVRKYSGPIVRASTNMEFATPANAAMFILSTRPEDPARICSLCGGDVWLRAILI